MLKYCNCLLKCNSVQFGGDKTIPNSTMDIEDLVQNGRQSRSVLLDVVYCLITSGNFFCSFCPYFLSRKMSKSADLIFMPYNYIIDRKVCMCVRVHPCVCVRVCVCVCMHVCIVCLHSLELANAVSYEFQICIWKPMKIHTNGHLNHFVV